MKRIAFLLFLTSGFSAAAQKEQKPPKFNDTLAMVPVEVQSVRAGVLAPFAKTNISKAEIEKQNLGQDLPFLFNQTPSVVVNSDAGNGVGYTGIHIRGTDATRINITLNGVPFNDAESQGTYFVDIPDFLSSTNSIQIQRGVGTSSNGAGAFGATIALSTNEVQLKPYAESDNTFGSFQTWRNTIKAGTGLMGNHFTVDARISRISSNGYIDRATSDLQSFYVSTAYFKGNASIRFNVFGGKEKTYQAWYGIPEAKLNNNDTALLTHYYNNLGSVYFTPADSVNLFSSNPRKYNYYTYPNQTDNYWQHHYQLFYNQKLSARWNFNTGLFYVKGSGYYEEYKVGQNYADYGMTGPTGVSTTDLVRQLWLDNGFFGDIFSLGYQSAKTQFTFGGSVTRYNGRHFADVTWAQMGLTNIGNYYDLNAYKNDANIYAKWQQALTDNWAFYTDFQWRHVRHVINGFEANPSLLIDTRFNFFNPKAGITYHKNGFIAYASIGIANKEPNRDDFEAGLNQQPQAERLNDLEMGVEKKADRYGWGINGYYMNYKNQLVLTGKINDVGEYTRTNIPDSYRMGIEMQGNYRMATWLDVAANLTLSKNRIRNFEEYIDDYDNGGQKLNTYSESDISFSPSIIGGSTITITPVKNFEVALLSKYVSKQYLDNTSNEHRILKPYFTEDFRMIYTLTPKWGKQINIIGQVNNLFNKMYEANGYTYSYIYNQQLITENYYFPMAGTNWMLGLNLKF
jgi:iron complex outermembrane receptor protein